MKRFDNTISKLKSNPLFQIKILQLPEKKVIANNINCAQMTEQEGGVEHYFEALFKKGYRSILIQDRRKAGSTFVAIDQPYEFTMSDKAGAPTTTAVVTQSNAIPAVPIPQGLSGGMNGVDFYRAMDYPKLETNFGMVQVENAGLKQKVAELEKQIMQHEFSTAKANATNEMISGFAPLLAPLLERLMPSPASAVQAIGLSGNANVSDIKVQAINIINASDENAAYYIALVAKNMNNELFQNQLFELLDRFPTT